MDNKMPTENKIVNKPSTEQSSEEPSNVSLSKEEIKVLTEKHELMKKQSEEMGQSAITIEEFLDNNLEKKKLRKDIVKMFFAAQKKYKLIHPEKPFYNLLESEPEKMDQDINFFMKSWQAFYKGTKDPSQKNPGESFILKQFIKIHHGLKTLIERFDITEENSKSLIGAPCFVIGFDGSKDEPHHFSKKIIGSVAKNGRTFFEEEGTNSSSSLDVFSSEKESEEQMEAICKEKNEKFLLKNKK
jgi:hypothetical protein